MKAIVTGALIMAAATAAPAERGLEIYWVDVEGGGATLIVTPARESVLIVTGFPGPRDAHRIHRVDSVWVPPTGHRQTYATCGR
jgi:hypothetical protein